MTATAQDQPLGKRRRRKINLIVGASALLLVIVVLEAFENEILRYAWRLWHGSKVTWRDITLEIDEGYFIFSRDDNEQLLIGRFGQSSETFPDDDIVMFVHRGSDKDDLFLIFGDVCKKITCESYQDRTELINGTEVRCIEFKAHLKPWPEPEFHVHCQAQGSDIMVEYHGAQQQYENFHAVISSALQAITQRMNREEIKQAEQPGRLG